MHDLFQSIIDSHFPHLNPGEDRRIDWSASDDYIDACLGEQAEREQAGYDAVPDTLSWRGRQQVNAIMAKFDRLIADMRAAVEAERRKI